MSYQSEIARLGVDTKGYFSGLHKFKCPKCSHTRKKQNDPSLSVNIDTGEYKCHHCDWKGNVRNDKKYVKPQVQAMDLDESVIAYFKGRGISPETVQHFRVTQSIEDMPQDGKKHKTINFNYYRGGELVNVKFKTREKFFKMVSGAEKIPYNYNSILNSDQIIICEGEEETMCWHEAGLPFAVSCPAGASKGNNNLEWLDSVYHTFENKKIFLATDNDVPGQKLAEDISRRFEPENIWKIDFGAYKDGNDVLKEQGAAKLKELFDQAKPLPIPEISSIGDFKNELMLIYESNYPKGDVVGYPELDKLISWKRGQFVVGSGIPGHGKTTFVDQVCIRLAFRKNWKFAIFSPENDNTLKSIRMAEQLSGRPLHGVNRMTKEQFERSLAMLESHFSFYDTDNLNDYNIDNLLRIGKSLVRQKGIDAIILDPFNYIDSDFHSDSGNEKIGKMLVKMKKFAKVNNVMVLLIAHPRKMQRDKNSNQYEIPRLYDISGSHHFANVADNGFVVHRDFDTGLVDIYVQKIKHYFMGKVGFVTMNFDVYSGRYKEINQDWETEFNSAETNDLFYENSSVRY
jgi:twinkle protein